MFTKYLDFLSLYIVVVHAFVEKEILFGHVSLAPRGFSVYPKRIV